MHEKVNFDRTIIPFYFLILELFGLEVFKEQLTTEGNMVPEAQQNPSGKVFCCVQF